MNYTQTTYIEQKEIISVKIPITWGLFSKAKGAQKAMSKKAETFLKKVKDLKSKNAKNSDILKEFEKFYDYYLKTPQLKTFKNSDPTNTCHREAVVGFMEDVARGLGISDSRTFVELARD